jgi:hypothetical protein
MKLGDRLPAMLPSSFFGKIPGYWGHNLSRAPQHLTAGTYSSGQRKKISSHHK